MFRCGPLLAVVLYMLKACLVASRSRLAQYLQVYNILAKLTTDI